MVRGQDPDGGRRGVKQLVQRAAQEQAQELAQLQNEEGGARGVAGTRGPTSRADRAGAGRANQGRGGAAVNRHRQPMRQAGLQTLQMIEAQAKQAAAELFASRPSKL